MSNQFFTDQRRAAPFSGLTALATLAIVGLGHNVLAEDKVTQPAATKPAATKSAQQKADSDIVASEEEVELPALSVEGQSVTPSRVEGYKANRAASPKLTSPLKDVPKTIHVVPEQLLKDQGASSLREAMRNVPGVTFQAGEGGGTQGDIPRIRGFAANNDIYINGLRDSGQYNRDPFNLESLEIYKGAESTSSGRGAVGGAINQVTKQPELTPFYKSSVTGGTDFTGRFTADLNQPLAIPEDESGVTDSAALRLNLMAHRNNVAGRNVTQAKRHGIAPSLALGIDTPTRINAEYMHFYQHNRPDYGFPFLNGKPIAVPRENFYGFRNFNQEEVSVDTATLRIEHDVNDSLTLRNQFGWTYETREAYVSPPSNANFSTNTITVGLAGREVAVQNLTNQTDLIADFSTFGFDHTVVTGVEVGREASHFTAYSFNGANAVFNLLNPNQNAVQTRTSTINTNTGAEAETLALHVQETMKLGPQFELNTGLRWDQFDANVVNTRTSAGFGRIDRALTWKLGGVYKPLPHGSIYASYATGFSPSAEALALNARTANVSPETSRTWELGTKWNLLDEKLSLTGALFRTEKNNARTPDPLNNTVDILDGSQRVYGLEIGISGNVTDKWQVYGGYTVVSSRIDASNTANEVGKEIQNVPSHAAALWTTYQLPYDFTVGFGGNYVAKRYANNTNTNAVDAYWKIDGMIGYAVTDGIDIQLNFNNLTDALYFEGVGGRAIPGAGRSVLLTTNFSF